VKTTRTRTISY